MRQDRPVPTERLASLHRQVVNAFSLEELSELCLYLGIRWESLSGDTIQAKTTSLLLTLNNNLQLDALFVWLEKLRPNTSWKLDDILAPPAPPYRGLEYYREQDAVIFFGRTALTAQLVEHLAGYPVLAVVGASGSGKSSVVRAGVIPALKDHSLLPETTRPPPDSMDWTFLTMTPGEEPMERLATAVTSDLVQAEETKALVSHFANDPREIKIAIEKYLQRQQGTRLCLLIDQFEELFSPLVDQEHRAGFIEGGLSAAAPGGLLALILCLRADYYHHCDPYPALRSVLEQHQAYIGPLQTQELRDVIVLPAKRRGYELEAGLTELVLRDAGDGPGRLPLISHALHETWLRREGALMTVDGYLSTGGVDKAIARTAEEVYGVFSLEQQALTRRVFLELIQLPAGGPETRRTVSRTALFALGAPDLVDETLEALISARLVVSDDETVQIAHEALIHHWPQLGIWLQEDRERLIFRQRLEAAAALWKDSNFDPDYLYSGRQLTQACERRTEYDFPPDDNIDDFLRACRGIESRRQRFAGLNVFLPMLAGAAAMGLSGYLLQTVWIESSFGIALITAAFAILGAIVGLLYTQGFDWALAWTGEAASGRWWMAVIFGFILFGLTLNLLHLSTPTTNWVLVLVIGGVWGVAAGVGRVWSKSQAPRMAVVGLVSGTVLASAYWIALDVLGFRLGPQSGDNAYLEFVALVAGISIPLAILLAEWVGMTLGRRSS